MSRRNEFTDEKNNIINENDVKIINIVHKNITDERFITTWSDITSFIDQILNIENDEIIV
jgi:hypothetical protein